MRWSPSCVTASFFLPGSVGLPSLTPTDAYDEDLDHPWHTFTEVTLTDEPPLRPEATLAALLAAWPSAAGSWDAAAWA